MYIATAASYFTMPIRTVGVVGGDFPEEGIRFLENRHIDIEGLEVVKSGKTFRWSARYHYDLNVRDTLSTELNVFETFAPTIPESYRRSRWVCLGNIDPGQQASVLKQVDTPRIVVGDTMNYWIERKNGDLRKTLQQIDILIVNDSEARLLANEPNLVKAGRVIRGMGPKVVIIKKGEHGAYMFNGNAVFFAPAYPLEEVFDPTGAGDSFAGGFMGYLARTGRSDEAAMRRAVVYGSTLGSFAVEKFSIDRLLEIHRVDIARRLEGFRKLVTFEEELE